MYFDFVLVWPICYHWRGRGLWPILHPATRGRSGPLDLVNSHRIQLHVAFLLFLAAPAFVNNKAIYRNSETQLSSLFIDLTSINKKWKTFKNTSVNWAGGDAALSKHRISSFALMHIPSGSRLCTFLSTLMQSESCSSRTAVGSRNSRIPNWFPFIPGNISTPVFFYRPPRLCPAGQKSLLWESSVSARLSYQSPRWSRALQSVC